MLSNSDDDACYLEVRITKKGIKGSLRATKDASRKNIFGLALTAATRYHSKQAKENEAESIAESAWVHVRIPVPVR